jgi:hypothetical protein
MGEPKAAEIVSGADSIVSYEAPSLTPLGNLADLLAGNTGTQFDCVSCNTTSGTGEHGCNPVGLC